MSSSIGDQKRAQDQFYLHDDAVRARLCILLLSPLFFISVFSEYQLFGLIPWFFILATLRTGFFIYSIFLFIYLNKVKQYGFYEKLVFSYALFLTALLLITSAVYPENVLGQFISLMLIVFIFYLVISFRYILQTISVLFISVGSFLIFTLQGTVDVSTIVAGILILFIALVVAASSSWQIHSYRAKIFVELTERKQAQESLQRSEQRWATTLSSIGDAVMATDLSGNITFMNRVAEDLSGWSFDEAIQQPIQKIFHIINEDSRKEVENPVDRVLREGTVAGLANHTVLVRKDGVEFPIDDSGSPIKNQNGQVTGVVLVFHDISERKKAEEALRYRNEELERLKIKLEKKTAEIEEYASSMEQLAEERAKKLKDVERLATIGATAGMVGHDIRNPLQGITSDVFLLKQYLTTMPNMKMKEDVAESLDGIEKNIDYINKIVQDLQDFARPLSPIAQGIDLESLCNEIFDTKPIPRNISASCQITKDTQKLISDPALLKRILTNLVNNAVQAMPNGGKLWVRAKQEAGDVIITVEDTGVGIPEEIQPKLFTPLFTTKSKGQGFGLAVVKRMTEALHGTISFETKKGEGTKFIIRLPQKPKR
jgi:PAS domain S-box-containing protein